MDDLRQKYEGKGGIKGIKDIKRGGMKQKIGKMCVLGRNIIKESPPCRNRRVLPVFTATTTYTTLIDEEQAVRTFVA